MMVRLERYCLTLRDIMDCVTKSTQLVPEDTLIKKDKKCKELRDDKLSVDVHTSSYIFLGFWSRRDLRLQLELPVTMPTTVDVTFCCPGPPWLFGSSSNMVSGSWDWKFERKENHSYWFLDWAIQVRTNFFNTYVRDRVKLGNLANFSGDEAKLFKIHLYKDNRSISEKDTQSKPCGSEGQCLDVTIIF